MYHRLAAVHHAAKADAYASTRMRAKAAGNRARSNWHASFCRRQRFGGAPRGTELYNAEQLFTMLSDQATRELFVDPVFVSSGHTFERQSITDWLRTNTTCPITRRQITSVLVTNHHARAMIDEFIAAYATREGDEWADIREGCAYCKAQRQQSPPDYTYGEGDLSEDDAIAYIRERLVHEFQTIGMDDASDDFIRTEFIEKATGNTHRELAERYEYWASHGH
jgi:hypothetical protein